MNKQKLAIVVVLAVVVVLGAVWYMQQPVPSAEAPAQAATSTPQ
jgi:hypothetical protein